MAPAEAKTEGLKTGPFLSRVKELQEQTARRQSELRDAERVADSRSAEWDRMMAAIDETWNIHEFWDTPEVEARSVIYDHRVAAVVIAVERLPDRARGHPRTAIVYLSEAPRDPKLVSLMDDNARSISSITKESDSTAKRSSKAAAASDDPTCPSAQATCPRTSGDGSDSEDDRTGTASGDPQLPSATATLRKNPARLARVSGEPREKDFHSASSIDMSSMSDGDSVPGCHTSAGSGCIPVGNSPGPRAACPGSSLTCAKRSFQGHTSWEEFRLPSYVIELETGRFRRRRAGGQ